MKRSTKNKIYKRNTFSVSLLQVYLHLEFEIPKISSVWNNTHSSIWQKIGFACFISEKVFNAEKFINFAFINWIFWKLLPSGRKCVIFQEEGIFWSVVKLIKFIWVSIFLIIKSILVFQGNSCIVAICFIPYLRTLRIMYDIT